MTFSLDPLFSDHAVVQRDRPVRVWGAAPAGSIVRVRLGPVSGEARADESSRWMLQLESLPAGGPHDLIAECEGRSLVRSDIWAGEVWLGAGQSNMEWTLQQAECHRDDDVLAGDARVRVFTVARARGLSSLKSVTGSWRCAEGKEQESMSATAYFFARRLAADLDMAVGVVVSAWCGTSIGSWLSPESMAALPAWAEDFSSIPRELESEAPMVFHRDPGRSVVSAGWESPQTTSEKWEAIEVPAMWQTKPGWDFNGAVWYRREIEIPAAWSGRVLRLELGKIDDFDDTFFNGVRVGGLDASEPSAYDILRRYEVPAALTRVGKALIAVRVFDHFGQGGLPGPATAMRLFPADEPEAAVSLVGGWLARVELPLPRGGEAISPEPCTLHHGMIAPIVDFQIRGALWYQGESDAPRAERYADALTALVKQWRLSWRNPDLGVGIVELPRFQPAPGDRSLGRWPELRAAQLVAALRTGAGLVPMIDSGDPQDIHPRNKRLVGARLADWALDTVYGVPREWRHVAIIGFDRHDDRWAFTFSADVRSCGKEIDELMWVTADNRRIPAVVRCEGARVEARFPEGVKPIALEHACADSPERVLCSARGLPVAPFRMTDR